MDGEEEDDLVFDQSVLLSKGTKLRDSPWCYRFFKTLGLSLAFLALGLCIAIPGPTLLDLQQRVHADTTHIAYIFSARSIGYLVGAIVGGYMFDRFDQKLLLAMTLFLTSIATAAAPWCTVLLILGIAFSFQGLAMGILDTGGNIYCLHIWGKSAGPYLQTMHALFGVGAFIAPFVAKPFLSPNLTPNITELTNISKHSLVMFPDDTLPVVIPSFDNSQLVDPGIHGTIVKRDVQMSLSDILSGVDDGFVKRDIAETLESTVTAGFTRRTTTTVGNSPTKQAVVIKKPVKSSVDGDNADGGNIRTHFEETEERDKKLKTTENVESSTVETVTIENGSVDANDTNLFPNGSVMPVVVNPPLVTKDGSEIVTTSTSTTTTTTATTTTTTATTSPTSKPIPQSTPTKSTKPPTTLTNHSTTTNQTPTTTIHHYKPKQTVDVFKDAIKTMKNMSRIQFAYLAIALVCLLSSILFIFIFCCDKHISTLHMLSDDRAQRIVQTSCYRIQLLILLFVFFFMYVGFEVTFGAFLLKFAVEYLDWSKKDGVILTAIYWGSFAAGRVISIPISRFMKPTYMLAIDLVLVTIASLLLSFALDHYTDIIFGATLILGLGLSSVFPTGLQWAESYMKVTGKATTVLVVGSALGEMAIPVLTGYFFVVLDKMSLMYMGLALSIVSIVVFVILQNLASNSGERYNVLARSDDSEMVDNINYDEDYVVFSQDSLHHRKQTNENGYHKLALDDD